MKWKCFKNILYILWKGNKPRPINILVSDMVLLLPFKGICLKHIHSKIHKKQHFSTLSYLKSWKRNLCWGSYLTKCVRENYFKMYWKKKKKWKIIQPSNWRWLCNHIIQLPAQLLDFWKSCMGWVQPCGKPGMEVTRQQPFWKILWSTYMKKTFLWSVGTCFIWTLLLRIAPWLAAASFYRRFLTWVLLFHLFNFSGTVP